MLGDDALQAAAETNEPIRMLGELSDVGAGLIVEPTDVRVGDEFGEVLIAFEIPRQYPHVVVLVLAAIRLVGEGVIPDEVELAAEEWFEFHVALRALLGFVPEIEEAEEVAVVGDGHRPHVHIARPVHQTIDA